MAKALLLFFSLCIVLIAVHQVQGGGGLSGADVNKMVHAMVVEYGNAGLQLSAQQLAELSKQATTLAAGPGPGMVKSAAETCGKMAQQGFEMAQKFMVQMTAGAKG